MIATINSVVGESCFIFIHPVSQKKTYKQIMRFKPKIEFTTEKPLFSQKTTIFT